MNLSKKYCNSIQKSLTQNQVFIYNNTTKSDLIAVKVSVTKEKTSLFNY